MAGSCALTHCFSTDLCPDKFGNNADNPAECDEAHPAAACALPICDADDDDALLALPHAESNLGLLTYKFCHDCACLAKHGMCAELREGLPGLDEVCGCSCAQARTPEERGCVAAALPTPAWHRLTPADDHDGSWSGPSSEADRASATTPAEEYQTVRFLSSLACLRVCRDCRLSL
eukprot:COSAG04_NODE_1352_length_7118_cov_26.021228_5_plen_176_part_00